MASKECGREYYFWIPRPLTGRSRDQIVGALSFSGASSTPAASGAVTALPLDVAGLYLVLQIPTAVKVGHVSIVTVKLLIITL